MYKLKIHRNAVMEMTIVNSVMLGFAAFQFEADDASSVYRNGLAMTFGKSAAKLQRVTLTACIAEFAFYQSVFTASLCHSHNLTIHQLIGAALFGQEACLVFPNPVEVD